MTFSRGRIQAWCATLVVVAFLGAVAGHSRADGDIDRLQNPSVSVTTNIAGAQANYSLTCSTPTESEARILAGASSASGMSYGGWGSA